MTWAKRKRREGGGRRVIQSPKRRNGPSGWDGSSQARVFTYVSKQSKRRKDKENEKGKTDHL